MASFGGRCRVLIATTTGPVVVLKLVPEQVATFGQSMVFAGDGRLDASRLSDAYHRLLTDLDTAGAMSFGTGPFRLDLSKDIDHGRSWQLGVVLAHCLEAAGRLAADAETADHVLWVTGSVEPTSLTIGAASHIEAKLQSSRGVLGSLDSVGPGLVLVGAAENAKELNEARKLLPVRDVVAAGNIPDLLQNFALDLPRPTRTRSRWGIALAAVLAAAISIGSIARCTSADPNPSIGQRSDQRSDVEPIFQSCPECPVMVALDPGTVGMGSPPDDPAGLASERPQVPITLRYRLAIGRFEVMVREYEAFVRETNHPSDGTCNQNPTGMNDDDWQKLPGSFREPGYQVSPAHPAACVSWDDAVAYTRWLAQRTGLPYRLPSEAEWEFAARAGTRAPYSFEMTRANTCDHARHADAATLIAWRTTECSSTSTPGTMPVASLEPNAWGVFDMAGNLWEWTADCWHKNHEGAATNGAARDFPGCGYRVSRGASWWNSAEQLRVAHRKGRRPNLREFHTGFRIALTRP